MRATARMSCSNPKRGARAAAIASYVWAHAAVERERGVDAKGKRAVQSSSKTLVNTVKAFQRSVLRKCLPKARGKRSNRPAYKASGPDLF